MGVISFFGFTLIELDGGKVWCAASEADFRKSMSRMGLSESAIEDAVRGKLARTGCYLSNGQCLGQCIGPYGVCEGNVDPYGHAVNCYCHI